MWSDTLASYPILFEVPKAAFEIDSAVHNWKLSYNHLVGHLLRQRAPKFASHFIPFCLSEKLSVFSAPDVRAPRSILGSWRNPFAPFGQSKPDIRFGHQPTERDNFSTQWLAQTRRNPRIS